MCPVVILCAWLEQLFNSKIKITLTGIGLWPGKLYIVFIIVIEMYI